MEESKISKATIVGKFQGGRESLGYLPNSEYALNLVEDRSKPNPIKITCKDGKKGDCEYASTIKFLENWRILSIVGESKPFPGRSSAEEVVQTLLNHKTAGSLKTPTERQKEIIDPSIITVRNQTTGQLLSVGTRMHFEDSGVAEEDIEKSRIIGFGINSVGVKYVVFENESWGEPDTDTANMKLI